MPNHTPGPLEVELQMILAGHEYLDDASDSVRRLIAAAPEMKDFLLNVPHNDMTATHRMIGRVAGCRGCEARALYERIDNASA